MLDELRSQKRVADALVRVAEQAGETIALPEVLARLCQLCVRVVPADRSTVFLWSRRRKAYVPGAACGVPPALVERALRRERRPGQLVGEAALAGGKLVVLSRDRPLAPSERELLDELGIHAMALVPLRARERPLGVLTVSRERADLGDASLAVLRGIARQASTLLDHALLFHREEEASRVRARIASLGAALGGEQDAAEIGRRLCAEAAALFGVTSAVLLVREGDWLVARRSCPDAATARPLHLRLDDHETAIVRAFHAGVPLVDNDLPDPPPPARRLERALGLRSALVVPLVGRTGSFGCLVVADQRRPFRFSEEAIDEARLLGTIAAAALERGRLFEELVGTNTALRRSEEHYRSIIELGSDVITILGDDDRMLYHSPSIERVLGHAPEDLVGRDPLPFIHPDDRAGVRATLDAVHRTPGVPGRVEFRFPHRDGSWRVMEGIAKTSAGVGVVVASRDVTERKQAEEALRREGSVAAALARVGQVLLPSLAAQELLERLCRVTTEVLACTHSTTWLWNADETALVPLAGHVDPPEMWDSLKSIEMPREAMASPIEQLERGDLVQVDGAEPGLLGEVLRHYETPVVLLMPLRTGAKLFGLQTAAHASPEATFSAEERRIAAGIAQLASTALANARLLGELARVNRLKSEFVSTMSHELRTPLNVILGYVDILRDPGTADADRGELHDRIEMAGRELMELIEATLTVGKMEAGRDEAAFEPVSLAALWSELRRTCAKSPSAVQVALEWQEDVPDVRLETDPGKLKVVVRNLVRNALKFTERGSVRVAVAVDDDACTIRVADTGVGIRPEDQATIFEMFRQADGSDRRRYGGTGLGLYIVRRFVTQLGGAVDLESALGLGSVFTVRLPRLPAARPRASG